MATLNNLASNAAARTAITEASGIEIIQPLMLVMPSNVNSHGGGSHSWLRMQAIEFLQQLGVKVDFSDPKTNLDPVAAQQQLDKIAGGVKKGGQQSRRLDGKRPQVKSSAIRQSTAR